MYLKIRKQIQKGVHIKSDEIEIQSEILGKIIIYQSGDGITHIDVKMEDETVWLTQTQLAELYQTSKLNVSEHIKHIFDDGELEKDSVVRNFRTTANDGKSYNVTYYNLDMIISLGYRIKSITATNFRRWATERLKEYMIKGFTMDAERLKQLGGGNYWHELLPFAKGLFTNNHCKNISDSAKILCGLMLDRMGLSIKNGWLDERNRLFIYFNLEDLQELCAAAQTWC